MKLEKIERIDEAKIKYIEAINLGFEGSHAYDRLNVFYRKEKNYEAEIENCKQAIKLFEDLVIVGRVDAENKLNKYKERLDRAIELNQKPINEFERSGTDSRGNVKYKHQCKKCRYELRKKNK